MEYPVKYLDYHLLAWLKEGPTEAQKENGRRR
jgi:hypothetical protein